MAGKRKRNQNFSMDEKDKLVKLVDAYRSIIFNKRTDGTTNQAKNKAWIMLCNQYNSTANIYRSKDALMRVWEKIKSEAKIYGNSKNKSCTTGTGGGTSNTKTDPILEQLSDLMGRGCSDIADVLDSDTDNDLRKKLLEKIEFKRKLYTIQLESAQTDLEIKKEILYQIKGGNLNLMNLFGVQNSN